jgi:hypothetical protein
MRYLITLLFLFTLGINQKLQAQAFPPPPGNSIVYIGEIRYNNDTPVFWDPHTSCEFYLKNSVRDSVKIDARVYPKESFYADGTKNTEIVFYLNPIQFWPGPVTVSGKLFTTDSHNHRVVKSGSRTYTLNVSGSVPLNGSAFKIGNDIRITAPEVFSLTSMNNYLEERMNNSSTKKGGYAAVVDRLEKMIREHDRRIPDFETMESLYGLYAFIKPYAADNSFYNNEAGKLKERIDLLQSSLTDTIPGKGLVQPLIPLTEQQDLLEELVTSQQVYDRYRAMYNQLNAYFITIPLLLQRKEI